MTRGDVAVPTWVALLRAVNLGGHNRVSMPVLREELAAAGFTAVRTYVNSGNVVAGSALTDPAAVAAAVRQVVAERFDLDVPVIVRSGEQLDALIAWNPFPDAALERPNLVSVVHLAAEPDPDRLAAVLAADVAPDRITARGTEVVIAYADRTTGTAAEKALRRLGTEGTARNWRTLRALADLART
jgi:uncharacterized protein (DUF1697 family)